ncbi:MAG TPA: NFACT RNA binding domain-containing protein [Candidatus Krumholzibacteria bacterium]|nr:NFACT RNA binding domain-containing protein [Candidatus Krumholzibacteria bacterium]
MNATLLARFAAELREALRWHYLDESRWFTPVLSLPFDRGRNHLVVVLEAPGPFTFLRDTSPFGGATAPVRFAMLRGAQVQDVSVSGRVLRIDVITHREEDHLSLRIALFGANGSATLYRGESLIESVGRKRDIRGSAPAGDAPAGDTAQPDEPFGRRFALVATRRVASAVLRRPDAINEPDAISLGVFNDARSACAHAGELILGEAQALMLHRIARPARKKLDTLRRLAANLENDIENARAHGDERRQAEALAAYQTRIRPGADSAEIPDLYDPGRMLHVTLDPSLPIHVQVEKRFRRAAKLEKGLAHLTRRYELVSREAPELEAALGLLSGVQSFGDALKLYEVMRAKFGIALERKVPGPAPSPRKTAREKTYRTFDLDSRWFVMVGRNNRENDQLTFHVAASTDWWFHAEGVAGSHVLLRPRGGGDAPPAAIIAQAASIAAHFSKARHSGLVPVIYTLRKYVRKFRGAEPGQVKCERETMVMVPPQLPAAE